MNRPIVIATIGMIIGIIWGLYLNISTILFISVFLLLLFFVINMKKRTMKRIKRYLKTLFKRSVLIILACSIVISFFYTRYRNNIYESIKEENEKEVIGEIQSSYTQNKQTYSYKIKVEGKLYILYTKTKKTAKEFEYGNIVKLTGKIELAEESRNYNGFNQRDYYKSKGVYGKIFTTKIEKVGYRFRLSTIINLIRNKVKTKIKTLLSSSNANILLGILIGDKDDIPEEQIEEFRNSSLIHILCVSRCTCWIYITLGKKIFSKKW